MRIIQTQYEFQSTPPRRRRHYFHLEMLLNTYFNPRLREGGDVVCQCDYQDIYHFNPRLREGGDGSAGCGKSTFIISIHASAKEATFELLPLLCEL